MKNKKIYERKKTLLFSYVENKPYDGNSQHSSSDFRVCFYTTFQVSLRAVVFLILLYCFLKSHICINNNTNCSSARTNSYGVIKNVHTLCVIKHFTHRTSYSILWSIKYRVGFYFLILKVLGNCKLRTGYSTLFKKKLWLLDPYLKDSKFECLISQNRIVISVI